jgi:hypothetical protein
LGCCSRSVNDGLFRTQQALFQNDVIINPIHLPPRSVNGSGLWWQNYYLKSKN